MMAIPMGAEGYRPITSILQECEVIGSTSNYDQPWVESTGADSVCAITPTFTDVTSTDTLLFISYFFAMLMGKRKELIDVLGSLTQWFKACLKSKWITCDLNKYWLNEWKQNRKIMYKRMQNVTKYNSVLKVFLNDMRKTITALNT